MGRRLVPLIALSAVIASVPVGDAHAAGSKKCSSPKGTRAPVRDLKAGFKTSCSQARKLAVKWDRSCEPYEGLCQLTVGRRWSCRATIYPQPQYRNDVYLKCGGKETTAGRPSVNFRQAGAVHPCADPPGTDPQILRLVGYYDAGCGKATAVARGWDSACNPGDDHSVCGFDVKGERWRCTQFGRPGIDAGYAYVCKGTRTGKGRIAVTFAIRVMPFP